MILSATVSNFSQNPMWWLAAIFDLMITETSNQNKHVTIVLSMVETPHLDISHGHSNRFIWHWLFCPNSSQNGALGPYIGPNDPHGGIFALGNMCFHKPDSDRDLWVPLKFCHQGGARGPLLPTRLHGARLGPVGPRLAPCWPHKLCFQGHCCYRVCLSVLHMPSYWESYQWICSHI